MDTITVEEAHEAIQLFVALRNAGLKRGTVQRVIAEPVYADKAAQLIEAAIAKKESLDFITTEITASSFSSPRIYNQLRREGITTIGALSLCDLSQVRMMHNMGPKGAEEIRAFLDGAGLTLRRPDEGLLKKAFRLYKNASDLPMYVVIQEAKLDSILFRYIVNDAPLTTLGSIAIMGEGWLRTVMSGGYELELKSNASKVDSHIVRIREFLSQFELQLVQ